MNTIILLLLSLFLTLSFSSTTSNRSKKFRCLTPSGDTNFGPTGDQKTYSATAAGDTDAVWNLLIDYKEYKLRQIIDNNQTQEEEPLYDENGDEYYEPVDGNPYNLCLMHMAALTLESDMVKLLNFAGYDANTQDRYGRTALHFVVDPFSTYNLWWVRTLLKGKRAWLNDLTNDTSPSTVEDEEEEITDYDDYDEYGQGEDPNATLTTTTETATETTTETETEIDEKTDNKQNNNGLPPGVTDPYGYWEPTGNFSSPVSAGQLGYYNEPLVEALAPRVNEVVELLLEFGGSPNVKDKYGLTPLMQAASGGLNSVVLQLLNKGGSVELTDNEGRTALHHATLSGNVETIEILLKHGADPKKKDQYGNSCEDIVDGAGAAVGPADALKLFGVVQAKPIQHTKRTKDNLNLRPGTGYGYDGGWSTEVLKENYPIDIDSLYCDVDRIQFDELTDEEFDRLYVRRDRPVVIEGMMNEKWPGWVNYSHDHLMNDPEASQVKVTVHGIPYVDGYSTMKGLKMPLGEYVKEMDAGTLGFPPKYVFHQTEVSFMGLPSEEHLPGWLANTEMGNKQFGIGAQGSGAQLHWHVVAWNALFYGRKLWFLMPPIKSAMTGKRALDWFQDDVPNFPEDNKPFLCVQHQGDVMLVPEMWGHAVLNVQTSICLATEFGDLVRPPWNIPSQSYCRRADHNHKMKKKFEEEGDDNPEYL